MWPLKLRPTLGTHASLVFRRGLHFAFHTAINLLRVLRLELDSARAAFLR